MNPYTILGVSTHATDLEIKRAYRNLVKRFHPDRRSSESSHEQIVLINQAYDILSDPEKRAQYDRGFSTTYVVQEQQEDPREVYRREYKRKRWEREKKEREAELASKKANYLGLWWVNLAVLAFGVGLILVDLIQGEGLVFWHVVMTANAGYICYQRGFTDAAYRMAKINLFIAFLTLMATVG